MDDTILLTSSKNQKVSKEQTFGKGIDIISSLSDNVLHHIFSFLSTEDCIRTSILSRRWQYLWISIADIDLVDLCKWYVNWSTGRKEDQCLMHQRFSDFVDRVLLLHDSSDIKRFRVLSFEPVDSSQLNSWISAAIRHNVQQLDLSLRVKTCFLLPCCLFTCESLVELKLAMDCVLEAPSCINFSSLKTLVFCSLTFSDDESTQHLLSNCPVLQELTLSCCGWENIKTLTISSPTLKRLTVEDDGIWVELLNRVVKIYAPNLIYLFICNGEVNFHLCDVSSLVSGSIALPYRGLLQQDVAPRVIGVLTGICNVKFLTIWDDTLESLAEVENLRDRLPTFHNMTHLEVNAQFSSYLSGCMTNLLEKTPKLESLDFIEGFNVFSTHDHRVDLTLERVPSCFCCIKAFSVKYFSGEQAEMHFLRFLLKNAIVLERMTIRWDFIISKDVEKEEINNQLRTFPRASESCLIELL